MSTQQIPTFAQLAAARKLLWHQSAAPDRTSVPTRDDEGDASAGEDLDELPEAGLLAGTGDDEAEANEESEAEVAHPEGLDEDESDGEDEGSENEEGDLDEDEADLDADEDGDDAEGVDGDDAEGKDDDEGDSLSDEDDDDDTADEDDEAEEEIAAAPVSAAVKTLEEARALIERAGLMPFVPHPALAAAPSPSFVEATLGEANASPTLAESATARSLLARMIAEGSAVPLNLLGAAGTTGETPDFVASTSAFPYVFTLRGDKGWKQLPETSGANKVSPLAVNTYGLLVEGGPQSAYALTGELGKGLTEQAVVRALTELWQQLRVIPVPQMNGKPTLWEPITSRLLRQVKAGANAGQPTALSALISLYLGQTMLATEDEIEVFLSTVAPRSRVRDVVHALMAAQELESMAIEGKQNVYIAGELPDFDAAEREAEPTGGRSREGAGPTLAEDGSRIRRMVKDTRPAGDRARPFRKDRDAGPRSFGDRPARGPRADAGGAREGGERSRPGSGFSGRGDAPGRRPFGAGAGRSDRPARPAARFDRPWEEGKRPARPAGEAGTGASEAGDRTRPASRGREFGPAGDRPRGGAGDRPGFGRQGEGRPSFDRPRGDRGGSGRPGGDRPGFDRARPERSGFAGDRPRFAGGRPEGGPSRFGGGAAGGRRDAGEGFARPREDRGGAEGGGERRPFRPAGDDRRGDRPRDFGGGRPGAGGGFGGSRGAEGGARRGGFSPDRGAGPRPGGFRGGDRPERAGAGGPPDGDRAGRPPFRKFDAPREGARPFRPAGRPDGDRPSRPAGGGGFGARPGGPRGPRDGDARGPRDGGARPFRPAGGGRFAAGAAGGDNRGPKRPFVKREGSGGSRLARPIAGAGGAGQEGPFDKFRDGNKPWGKRPPKRKIKPEGEEG